MRKMVVRVSRFLAPALLAGFCLALPACGAGARVHVTKPVSVKLEKYNSATLEAHGQGPKLGRAARKFRDILGEHLKSEKVFKEVSGSGGDIVFRITVTNMELGNESQRELALKGKAKFTAEIRITKPSGEVLGHFTVTASAAKKNEDDQPALRVLERAAEKVVEHLQKEKSK